MYWTLILLSLIPFFKYMIDTVYKCITLPTAKEIFNGHINTKPYNFLIN